MSDIEINAFKDAANGKLHRSSHSNKQVDGEINTQGATSYKRTSKQIWLADIATTITIPTDLTITEDFPLYNEEAFGVGKYSKGHSTFYSLFQDFLMY